MREKEMHLTSLSTTLDYTLSRMFLFTVAALKVKSIAFAPALSHVHYFPDMARINPALSIRKLPTLKRTQAAGHCFLHARPPDLISLKYIILQSELASETRYMSHLFDDVATIVLVAPCTYEPSVTTHLGGPQKPLLVSDTLRKTEASDETEKTRMLANQQTMLNKCKE